MNLRKAVRRTIQTSVMLAAILAAAPVAYSATVSTNGATATGTQSTGCCPGQCQAIQAAEQAAYNSAQQIYQSIPPPANLQSSTCFSNILNMGSSIGLSFFNPAQLLQQMEQMACSAAQNAVQWPVQQAENFANQNGQLPYGLGGVSVGTNGSGTVNTYTGSSSGPSLSLPSTGNSTLNNILG